VVSGESGSVGSLCGTGGRETGEQSAKNGHGLNERDTSKQRERGAIMCESGWWLWWRGWMRKKMR